MARIMVSIGACLLAACPLTVFAQAGEVVFSNQFESGAASLSPDLVYARAGSTTTGIAGPLLLQLDAPVAADTFVPIVSLTPGIASVDGGGVTIAQGLDAAVVTVTGIASSPTPVLLRASLGNQVYASVRVFDDDEPREVVSLRPNPIRIAPGGQRSLIATLNLPAASTGTAIDLSVAPLGAGSFTTPITVAANSFSQSFVYTDNDISEFATLSASAGTPPVLASIQQSPIGKLVINEVDYDQPAALDTSEFIEIFNRSPDTVALTGLSLMLVNGSQNPSAPYLEVALADATSQLAPGEYLVVAHPSVVVPNGTPFIAFADADSNIQNGAPDAIAIVDTEALTVIDALSYEGSVTQADLPGFPASVNLVEGTATTAVDGNVNPESLSRLPNGTDNNNADTDIALTATLTPGFSNDPVAPGGHLVINEVDYDQASTDAASFIEIFNPTGSSVALTNLAVVLVNGGNNTEYARFDLSTAGASLTSGQYLVIHNSTVTIPVGTLAINASGDFIQNGGPDGIALIDTSTNTVIDALSYEGSITAAIIVGFPGPVTLVEGSATTRADTNDNLNALVRSPGGADTDDALSDWILSNLITPGAANPPSDNETGDARELDFCNLQFPATASTSINTPTPMIYGRVFETGLTEAPGASAGIVAQVGYGPNGSDPAQPGAAWLYVPASFNVQVGNDDEYQANLTVPQAGTFAYTFRFSRDGGAHWTYCDVSGAGANGGLTFEPANLGTLTVNP